MQIQVNFGSLPASDPVERHVERQVRRALRRYSGRTTRVEVHLNDLNGPKGGPAQRCLMEARLAGRRPLAVRHDDTDLYVAITAAADKLHQAVGRRMGRVATRSEPARAGRAGATKAKRTRT